MDGVLTTANKANTMYPMRGIHSWSSMRRFGSLLRFYHQVETLWSVKSLTPNDHYSGKTAPLTSQRFMLHIYSTNIGTEYFKQGIYSPYFSLQNEVCFIILTYLVPVIFTFYIQGVLKLKKYNSGAKGLIYAWEKLTKGRDRLRKTVKRTNKWPINKRDLIRRHYKE